MENRLADEALYFGAVADAEENTREEMKNLREENTSMRNVIQKLMDTADLTIEQYEMCRKALPMKNPVSDGPGL